MYSEDTYTVTLKVNPVSLVTFAVVLLVSILNMMLEIVHTHREKRLLTRTVMTHEHYLDLAQIAQDTQRRELEEEHGRNMNILLEESEKR